MAEMELLAQNMVKEKDLVRVVMLSSNNGELIREARASERTTRVELWRRVIGIDNMSKFER